MKHNYTSSFQRDVEATNGGGLPNTAEEIVKALAEWSLKYPRQPIYGYNRKEDMDAELIAIEEKAKDFLNSTPNDKPSVATDDASSTEFQKQLLIDIMDEDQKDGLYDDITIPKELDDWATAAAMDSFQDAADKPIMDILLRGTFYRGECAAIKKLMPEIERLKKENEELKKKIDTLNEFSKTC